MAAALACARLVPPWWCGREAAAWLAGDDSVQGALADELAAFEARDDAQRRGPHGGRFAGEWALVTHQMIALGLSQVGRAHPSRMPAYLPAIRAAAEKSFLPEMRDFGTEAWHGEDALAALADPHNRHGHAYLAYAALAVGVARQLGPLPPALRSQHDLAVAAWERLLGASPTGLIETYPGEAYPTDVAAVAAAIAVHGRATGVDHGAVLRHWARAVRAHQIDGASGLVHQRMGARDGRPHDAPRGSGTGLCAYFAGFADRQVADLLAEGLLRQHVELAGFGAVREYAPGHHGAGDVDSGPVVLGVSVAGTGFALAPLRALQRREAFTALFRTTTLFGVPLDHGGLRRYATGGPIGNALLLALLTSGPERAP